MGKYVVFEVDGHREKLWAWCYHDGGGPGFSSIAFTRADGVTPVTASPALEVADPDLSGPALGRKLFEVHARAPEYTAPVTDPEPGPGPVAVAEVPGEVEGL